MPTTTRSRTSGYIILGATRGRRTPPPGAGSRSPAPTTGPASSPRATRPTPRWSRPVGHRPRRRPGSASGADTTRKPRSPSRSATTAPRPCGRPRPRHDGTRWGTLSACRSSFQRGRILTGKESTDLGAVPADEVLRGRDHPGRSAHPVLRLQLRRLPRAGPRPDVRRARSRRRPERHRTGTDRDRLAVRLQERPQRPGARSRRRSDEHRATGGAAVSTPAPDPATIKACCATAYGSDAVAVLLGDCYHPGGLALTRRLTQLLGLRPGDRVADIAAGPGTTARLLAAEYGVRVDAVDLRPSTVDAPGVCIHVGDAQQIPLPDEAFDAVICECAFCTFPDKPAAAAEFARLLR